jgi:hypothetical protein
VSELDAVTVEEGMADLGHVGSTLIADPLVKFCSPVCVFCSTLVRSPALNLPSLETLRHQFECRRRNRHHEGKIQTIPHQPACRGADEYKMTNIPDKPSESMFDYITVLPGAFSAYRYITLQNDQMGEGPLQIYFLGEKMHGAGAVIFTSTMYFAEDRVSVKLNKITSG